MRAMLIGLGLGAALMIAPVFDVAAQDCFPGKGIGVGGTPGNPGSTGSFPGGGATGGTFPGGNCSSNVGSAGTVSAAEPLTLGLLGVGLIGVAVLRRR